jgi:hypothetical protein
LVRAACGHLSRVIAIDWSAAEVRDGRLRVPYSDRPSKAWVAAFARVAERLERTGSGWGEVSASRQGLEVDGVSEGEEPGLRHFLESALLQANAAEGAEDDEDGGGEPLSDADRRMTEAFRAFAD